MITPYPAQEKKIEHIVKYLKPDFPILDTSKTGTGKTYTALWSAQRLGLKPFIVCPKSTISVWKQASNDLGIEIDDVVNYEKLRYGTHKRMWTKITENKVGSKIYKNFNCQWTQPIPQMIIFDEAHVCSGMMSQVSGIMTQAFNQKIPTLCLTATVADSPLKLKAIGYIMRLHVLNDYYTWIRQLGCYRVDRRGWKFNRGKHGLKIMKQIHDSLTRTNKMIQITPNDLPSAMNDGIIIPDLRDVKTATMIQSSYQLGELVKARQQSEEAKMDIFIEDGKELLDEGNSVIFFVNFHKSVDKLKQAFPDAGILTGNQNEQERKDVVDRFQRDELNIIIAISAVGGMSISLHDINGNRPRVSLISPSYNALELIQVLGRTVRAGGKTTAIRKIVFAANTIEEVAYHTVRSKIKAIDTLTDGDLTTF